MLCLSVCTVFAIFPFSSSQYSLCIFLHMIFLLLSIKGIVICVSTFEIAIRKPRVFQCKHMQHRHQHQPSSSAFMTQNIFKCQQQHNKYTTHHGWKHRIHKMHRHLVVVSVWRWIESEVNLNEVNTQKKSKRKQKWEMIANWKTNQATAA